MADGQSLFCRAIGDELVVHDRVTGRLAFLNATARRVWEMLSAGRTIEEAADALREACPEAERAEVGRDVEACRAELLRLGLLERPGAPVEKEDTGGQN